MSTTAASVLLEATLLNVSNAAEITLMVNGAQVAGAVFNAGNGNYNKTISLIDGRNTISIIVATGCGKIQKDIEITHGEEQKITICHYPPGNTGNPQQIDIPISAWPAHQAHGDVQGPCPSGNSETNPTQGSGIGIGGSGGGNDNGGGDDGDGGDGDKGDGKSGEDPGKGGVKPIEVKPKEEGVGKGGN
ncbi:MAG: hypothetical protein A3D92_18375 [Bacteroidetes bacterium RIFCSPHIGHO2_02_FULL_44_7]|nr:MAG: hypothetical protein A3D92_18375 [Bacteroidetes bacterium RIFCSPHIGHO2_02_FULL_44_7]